MTAPILPPPRNPEEAAAERIDAKRKGLENSEVPR